MRWLWWLLGIGVVGGVGYYIISSSTGKKVPAKTACVADLPEVDRAEVKRAIDAGDASAMTWIATKFDSRGFTCAATELRAAALKARAATAGIDAVPEPQRSTWRKLLDRALSEADPGGDLISSLEAASKDAGSAGYAKVRDLLRDASRDVRRTIKIVRITEEPPKKKIDDALAAARREPAKATVDALRSLAAQLRSLGYEGAAKEADATADEVQKKIDAAGAKAVAVSPDIAKLAGPSTAEFGPLLAGAFAAKSPLDALPADLRAEVDAAYASGDPQQLDDVAVKLVGIPYAAAWKKVKNDAAALRARWYARFVDLPIGKGSVFSEIDSSGEATIPGTMPTEWGKDVAWAEVKPIADALWRRGYRTAANQLAEQYMRLHYGSGWVRSIDEVWWGDAAYPRPPA